MYSGLYERRPDTPFIFTNGRERKYNMAEQSLKEKTAKGLFWGGFSNGIQQLLNLLFGIIITRMLYSTDYGMIGMLAIFTAVANSIQESGFTAALANKKTLQCGVLVQFSNGCIALPVALFLCPVYRSIL